MEVWNCTGALTIKKIRTLMEHSREEIRVATATITSGSKRTLSEATTGGAANIRATIHNSNCLSNFAEVRLAIAAIHTEKTARSLRTQL